MTQQLLVVNLPISKLIGRDFCKLLWKWKKSGFCDYHGLDAIARKVVSHWSLFSERYAKKSQFKEATAIVKCAAGLHKNW